MDPKYKGLGFAVGIILSLLGDFLGKGYCVTMDNFYNSPSLCDMLVKCKTDVYETL